MRAGWHTLGTICFFGTLWGASEVLLGEALRHSGLPHISWLLTPVALLLLALADRALPRAGSLAGVAGVAALYRLATAGPFWCHVVAILAVGAIFDGVRRVFPLRASHPLRTGLTAAGLAYAAHFVFAALMTWAWRYGPWVRAGAERLREHVLLSGTLAALLAAVLVPVAVGAMARGTSVGRAPAAGLRAAGVPLAVGLVGLLWVAGFLAAR